MFGVQMRGGLQAACGGRRVFSAEAQLVRGGGGLLPVTTRAVTWVFHTHRDVSYSAVERNLLFLTFLGCTQNRDINWRSASECGPYRRKWGWCRNAGGKGLDHSVSPSTQTAVSTKPDSAGVLGLDQTTESQELTRELARTTGPRGRTCSHYTSRFFMGDHWPAQHCLSSSAATAWIQSWRHTATPDTLLSLSK